MDVHVSTRGTGRDDTMIVAAEGEIDIATVDELAEPAEVAVSQGWRVILDLSACSFIDSSGLRFVIRLHKALAEDGKAMAVVSGNGQVRKLLYLTGTDHNIPIFATLGDAVRLLGAVGANGAVPVTAAAPAERPSA